MKTQNAPTQVNKFALATLSALTALACLFGIAPNARASTENGAFVIDATSATATDATDNSVIDGSKIFTEVQARAEAEVKDQDLGSETLRRSLIRVDLQALKQILTQNQGRPVRLNLFPDRPLDVIFDSVDTISPENIVATGRVADDTKSAVGLAINNGVVVANIQSPKLEKRYEIRPAGTGLHAVREQGADTATECGTADNTRQ
jgi:hypothetical protein